MASGVVLSRNNQTQQNLFKFGFLSPVWALPTLLLVLACTVMQSARVGASCPATGVGMCGKYKTSKSQTALEENRFSEKRNEQQVSVELGYAQVLLGNDPV